MHFSTIAITLLGAAASASASIYARQTLPNCAVTCTANADLGGCVVTDTHCLCTNAAFVNSTTTCVEASCTGTDLQSALKASQDLCAKVGVTLTGSSTAAPAASSAASSAASASGSGSVKASATGSGSAASASATKPSGSSSGAAPASTSAKASSASSSYAVNALFGAVAAGVVAFTL